ncbi:LLM class flavin-dependent oxidoreductase [bacterium]|nr:LLM class flavin-dependent oxidoreductase [bacterium]
MSMREISLAFQTDKRAAEYIALAKLVNQYVFDGVSVYCDAPFHPSFGPLLLMAPYLDKAQLGPAAVSPYRIHPIDIAAETALLADLAQGGVYVGLARGAWLAEHGIQEPRKAIQGIREAVQIVRQMLSEGHGGFDGEVFRIDAHVRTSYPLPKEPIPIMIGTWGQKLARVAGELADEVKIGGSANPGMAAYLSEFIHQGELLAGRDPDSVRIAVGAVTVVDEDREQARQLARREVALYLPVVASLDPTVSVEPEMLARMQAFVQQQEYTAAANLISDDLLDRFAFSGGADDLIEQANALFEAGVSRIEFGTPHGISAEQGIVLIGEKVLPELKRY